MQKETFCTISTAHVPENIEKALERGEIAEIASYIEADVKTVIYGCLVYVPEHIPVEIPKELEILFEWAQKEDISILCLDSDGEIVPELPTYEWSDSAVADITRKVISFFMPFMNV